MGLMSDADEYVNVMLNMSIDVLLLSPATMRAVALVLRDTATSAQDTIR
jgi:hypothetical protein